MITRNSAPLKRRFIALGIDYLVILAYGLLLFGCAATFYQLAFQGIPDVLGTLGRGGSQLLGFTALTLPVGLYFYLTESVPHHATFGKRIANIKVASISHKTVSKQQIAVRTLVKLLPWEFAHTFVYQVVYYTRGGGTPPTWVMMGLIIANILPLLYVATILVRKDHRGPHDLAAQTVVSVK